jgi:hypothetical protein
MVAVKLLLTLASESPMGTDERVIKLKQVAIRSAVALF